MEDKEQYALITNRANEQRLQKVYGIDNKGNYILATCLLKPDLKTFIDSGNIPLPGLTFITFIDKEVLDYYADCELKNIKNEIEKYLTKIRLGKTSWKDYMEK